VQANATMLVERPFFLALALGLGGTGMSLMWTRRVSWSVIAGIWVIALLAGLLAVVLRAG